MTSYRHVHGKHVDPELDLALLNARLVWVEESPGFHVLRDQVASDPRDFVPMVEDSQGQVFFQHWKKCNTSELIWHGGMHVFILQKCRFFAPGTHNGEMHFAQRHHVLLIFSPPIKTKLLYLKFVFLGKCKDELNFPQLRHLIEDPAYDMWYFKADSLYRL